MLVTNQGKEFEKPDNGLFLAVLADIVYIKDKPTKFGPKDTARLIWILDAKGKDGSYYTAIAEATMSLNEKARLYGYVKDIRNGVVPPVPFELDELIGSVNQVVIVREKSADGKKEFSNIKAIMPKTANQSFAIPAGYVRVKDRPPKGAQTQAASASPQSVVASAQQPAASVQAPATAVDKTAEIPF